MKLKSNKGFTLIELLIVIAIIGILAAILLPNLINARAKAQDASKVAEINGVRVEAELFYDNNSLSYGTSSWSADTPSATLGVCSDNAATVSKIESLLHGASATLSKCDSGPTAYAAKVQLSSASGSLWYCVDSTGYAGKTTTTVEPLTSADFNCDADNT